MYKLFIYIPLLFSACNNLQQASTNAKLAAVDTVSYSYNTVNAHSQYFIANDDNIDTTFFKITYPVFLTENLNDRIRKHILIDGENTAAQAAQSFIDGFDEFAGDNNANLVNASWYKEVNSYVELNTPLLITLKTQVSEYSGGAHGQHFTLYANYDILSDKTLEWKDILEKDKLKLLTVIAEKYFRKQENIDEKASLAKDFFFEDGIFTLNDNFGFSKNNLIIFYNEYEIRPYAFGPTMLKIPYTELEGILNFRAKEYIQSIL